MSAIVTTIRCNPAHYEPVLSFVAYHLSIGFSHIYVFIDHSSNNGLLDLLIRKFTAQFVTVFLRTVELEAMQREKCSTFKDLEPYFCEVPARQTVNAEYAYVIASEQFKWLLHIDIDELFYISGDSGDLQFSRVDDHFDYLDSLGVKSMTYVNHEGMTVRVL